MRTVNGDNSFSDGLIFNGEFVESERGRGEKREKERNKQRRLRVDSLLRTCCTITWGATVLKFVIKKFAVLADCNVEICFFEGGINIHFLPSSGISIRNDSFVSRSK